MFFILFLRDIAAKVKNMSRGIIIQLINSGINVLLEPACEKRGLCFREFPFAAGYLVRSILNADLKKGKKCAENGDITTENGCEIIP
jgi:hypothetical protein